MNKIDQKEYLKRYLCSDDKLEKKKKKKKSKDKPHKLKETVKIIDDDALISSKYEELDEGDLYATNEEAPQIVGMIDERAPSVIMKQEYEASGKWKSLQNTNAETFRKSNKGRNDSDESLERKSPVRRERNRKNSDESPPRKRVDSSPAKRSRRNSNESPPRRSKIQSKSPARRHRRQSDESPPRRSRKDSDNFSDRKNRRNSDESPPRRFKKPSRSPARRPKRFSDESPPRRNRRNSNESRNDRRQVSNSSRRDSDSSPPRKSLIKQEPADDYERSRSKSLKLLKSIKSEKLSRSPEIKRDRSRSPHTSRMTKTLDGKASGLQNAKNLKDENERFRARQDKLFREMNAEMSGKNADVVIRDRKGRNKDFEYDVEKERRKIAAEEERQKEYDKWGKGLKQLEEIEKRRQEYLHEASKPLARSENDEDLQDYLKNQERADDPMLQYMRRKKQEENKSKGILEKPKYNGQFPDNRFNIRPGYRWDGVDRSNGYEKKYFSMINSKKSVEEDAYRYSTEDM